MSCFIAAFLVFQGINSAFCIAAQCSEVYSTSDKVEGKKKADFTLGIVHVKKADAYFDNGSLREAIKEYTVAIELGVGTPAVFFNRGLALFHLKRFDEARRDCDEAIARGVKKRVFTMRAITHMSAGKFELAVKDYTQAIKNGDGETLVYDRGIAYLGLFNLESALRDFDTAIRINKTEPAHFRYRGVVYSMLRDYKRGIADFNEAISLNPKDIEAYWGKAQAYRELRDAKSYKEVLAKIERLNPKDPRIYVRQGLLSLQERQIDKAIGYFKRGLECEKEWGFESSTLGSEAVSMRKGDLLRHLGKAQGLRIKPCQRFRRR